MSRIFSLKMDFRTILFSVIFLLEVLFANCKLREGECEVCVKFIGKFIDQLSDSEVSSPPKIEASFREFCKTARSKEERLCYYIGGLETSATGILGEMSKPISWSMPVEKVCEKLSQKDAQVCELKYDKQIDFATVNLKKLKVRDLRKILDDWGEQCRGCTEKSEFVKLVEDLIPKYAPDAAKTRAAKTDL